MMRIYILALLTAALTAVAPASAQTELSGSIAGMTMTGGSYKLVGNLSTSKPIYVSGTVTLDLNGFVLKRTGTVTDSGSGYENQTISVNTAGNFTIIDSNPTKANTGAYGINGAAVTINGGIITGGRGDRGGIIYSRGTVNFNGGTLAGGKAVAIGNGNEQMTDGCGGAVYVDNGIFTMNGGHIAYCQTEKTDAAGTFGVGKCRGGAVFVDYVAEFRLQGTSRIYGCKAARGGAVYVHTSSGAVSNGTLTSRGVFRMSGGEISDCVGDIGGAVLLSGGSLFEMSGGTICNNRSDATNEYWGGGGVFVNRDEGPSGFMGEFNMSGGSITGNRSSANGCGIHSTGTVNVSGGTISGNVPSGWTEYLPSPWQGQYSESVFGGGIYVRYSGSTLTVTGGDISDNVAACGGGVYLKEGAGFVLSESSDQTYVRRNRAMKQMDYENGGGGVFVNSGCSFTMTGGTLSGNMTTTFGNAVHSQGTFTMSGGSILDNVPADWVDGEEYIFNHPDGLGSRNTHGGGVFIYSSSADRISIFTLSSGEIKDNIGASGGAVMVWNNARFDMSGGILSGNKAVGTGGLGNGGAVYVNSTTSAFNFNGGTIEGNSSLRYGGAININQGSTLNLISGNILDNSSNYGGGISQEQGECSMTINEGITLSNNTAAYDGGGLFVETGTVTLEGCTISENSSDNRGGAIYMDSGSLNIESGTLKDNKVTAADGYGGAIVLNQSGSMDVGQAELVGNSAPDKGGCIYVGGSLTVTGKLTVKDNFAGNEAGAILVAGGDLSIADCEISGNKAGYDADGNIVNAAANGGAISITDGAVTITKGQISNNISTGYGGGLYVANTGSSKNVKLLGGGVFEYNTASHGGGLYVSGDIIMEFQGSVAFNTARCGGGVLLNGADLTIKGGLIRNNRAVPDINDPDAADALTKPETGYLLDFTELSGIGGGIYLSTASTLQFDISSELGVYENDATWGADDIFANGNGTSVILPDVVSMTLTGYRVPTTELYWAEDYITDDTRYDEGSYIMSTAWSQKNDRYDDAIMDPSKSIYRIDYASFTWPWTKYLCLELGYAFVIVDVVKQGMKTGESAVIVFTPAKNKVAEGVYEVAAGEKPYVTVIFVGEGTGKDVTRQVALPSGWWEIKEDPAWSWTYEGEGPYYNEVLDPDKIVEVTLEKLDSEGKLTYIFRNSAGSDIPESAESVVVNRMNSPL